jgi:hypothetical protein
LIEDETPIDNPLDLKKSDYLFNVLHDKRIPNESKISKTLSERTTRTVIVLILLMLFLMPLF